MINLKDHGKDIFPISLDLPEGMSLSDALTQRGIRVTFPCGKRGSCGKCKAIITGAVLDPTPSELLYLTEKELNNHIRLLCQTYSAGGKVTIHSLLNTSNLSILVDGFDRNRSGSNVFKTEKIRLNQAKDCPSQWDRLFNDHKPQYPWIKTLPSYINNMSCAELAYYNQTLVRVNDPDKKNRYYGIGFDIGTTTVVGYLVNLITGQVEDTSAMANPQAAYGVDVMSRIAFSSELEGLTILYDLITEAISEISLGLLSSNHLAMEDLVIITLVGNTCMHHLLLELNPKSLGEYPYLPLVRNSLFLRGEEIGLKGLKNTWVWVGPIIGGFVGADAVAAAVSTKLCQSKEPSLLVDLGTNGEILLWADRQLLACSTAAGPAFEGSQISCGMRAEPGAIDGCSLIDGRLGIHVLDNKKPKGICSSGLVDLIAILIETGLVDETGRLLCSDEAKGKPLSDHLISTPSGPAFALVKNREELMITQKDLREVQLAKGAVRAGIEVCCAEMGIKPQDLSKILLAGAFGNYISKENALKIGIFPEVSVHKIKSVGNAAGAGAVLALVSQKALREFEKVRQTARHLELGSCPAFQERFVDAMLF
jgi:uncharacterized 2Fe-2S/4Fe-4S cluster protein (DUF4445 family)